jgi:hypothetical protein
MDEQETISLRGGSDVFNLYSNLGRICEAALPSLYNVHYISVHLNHYSILPMLKNSHFFKPF